MKRGQADSQFTLGIGHLNLSRANRSQVTIFIIVGILIVVAIGSFFLLFGTFGSVASKILLSRGKGHVVYLLQGVGSLLSLAFLLNNFLAPY